MDLVEDLRRRIEVRNIRREFLEKVLSSGDLHPLLCTYDEDTVLPGHDGKCDLDTADPCITPCSAKDVTVRAMSACQLSRLVKQSRAISSYYYQMNERDGLHIAALLALKDDEEYNPQQHRNPQFGFKLLRDRDIQSKVAKELGLGARTLQRWLADFQACQFKGFSEDGRGKQEGNWILLQV
eukprot:scaffold679122_cov78-Prasinocladus_malaysianus.AAC.1